MTCLRLCSYVRGRTRTQTQTPSLCSPPAFPNASLSPGTTMSDPVKAPTFDVFLPGTVILACQNLASPLNLLAKTVC